MSHRFSQSVKNSPIGPLDRALGIAFGVVRGLVIVGLAYLAFTYFVPIRNQPALAYARPAPADGAIHRRGAADGRSRHPATTLCPQHEETCARRRRLPPAMTPWADLIRKNEAANSVPKSTPQRQCADAAQDRCQGDESLWRQRPPRARQPRRDDRRKRQAMTGHDDPI